MAISTGIPRFTQKPIRRRGQGQTVIDKIICDVGNFITETGPSALGAAMEFHKQLVANGLRSEDDEIFYNFDYRYKIKFVEEGVQTEAVFWSPWIGGISWHVNNILERGDVNV